MNGRKRRKGSEKTASADTGDQPRGCSILVVSTDAPWRKRIASALRQAGFSCHVSDRLNDARVNRQLKAGRFDVAVVETRLPDGDGTDLAVALQSQGKATLLVSHDGALDDAIAAMQCGAVDLITGFMKTDEIVRRVETAAMLVQTTRENMSSAETTALAAPVADSTTSEEFARLVKGELDLEALLRRTLEFILSRAGATNAAIFLPTSVGDYSLGAYINYDCPKESADMLLDHLANVVAPKFEELQDIHALCGHEELVDQIGRDAEWLGDSHVLAFSCMHDDECLAIFMLFRDSKVRYTDRFVEQLRLVRSGFTAQLAKVIAVHHRHIPRDEWGTIGESDEDYDDWGMAA